MGAVTFSLDPGLVECLRQTLPLSTFVETGTFQGDGVAIAAPHFDRIVTIEYSEGLWREATERFRDMPKVAVHHGDSSEVLRRIVPGLHGVGVLYWLDAHWCVAESTAGRHSQCPLLKELEAIGRLEDASVVLIDDARLFLAPPPEPHDVTQWPAFREIVKALGRLSGTHELMVLNDVIAYYPPAARGAMHDYARKHGTDWLRASQSLAETGALRTAIQEKDAAIEEKEAAIQTLHQAADDLQVRLREIDKGLQEKEAVIQSLRLAGEQRGAGVAIRPAGDDGAGLRALQAAVEQLASQQALLAKSLEEKQSIILTLQKSVDHYEAQWDDLVKSIGQKDDAIRRLNAAVEMPEVHLATARALEEKEAVIQELSAAVNAYRKAFSLFGFMVWPFNYILAPIRRVVRTQLNLLIPRLGNLNQHGPIGLRVSSHIPRVTMSSPPKVSIVTPSFRQSAFIERTVKSVIGQQYPNLEYIVQDGGSEDGTREILERYAERLTAWESTPDSGQAQAINRGFARATGEIMAWLNSDDILLPGALAHVADFFHRHPDVDVVYGHRVLIDESDQEIGRWVLPAHDDGVLSWADFVPQETLFWRRRIWEKAGGKVDESFQFALDWDLLVRFREAGARFARIPRFLGGFRIHVQQKTSASISDVGFGEMNRIRERVLGFVPSPLEIRKALAPYLLRHVATDLGWRIRNRLGMTT